MLFIFVLGFIFFLYCLYLSWDLYWYLSWYLYWYLYWSQEDEFVVENWQSHQLDWRRSRAQGEALNFGTHRCIIHRQTSQLIWTTFLHVSLSNDYSFTFLKAPRWEVCFQDDLSAKVVSPALINLVLCLATIVIILGAAVQKKLCYF